MDNLYSHIPPEIIARVSRYTDSRTRRALSMVDRRTHEVVLDAVKSIRLFAPWRHPLDKDPITASEDILIKVISRYRNLNRICISKPSPETRRGIEFEAKDAPYLNKLIINLAQTFFFRGRSSKLLFPSFGMVVS